MRFLRLNETRSAASLVALAAWASAMVLAAGVLGTLPGTMPMLIPLAVNLLPVCALLLPAALAYVAMRAGRVPAIVCAAVSVVACAAAAGRYAALLAGLLLMPPVAFSIWSYERKRPFWPSVGICAGMLLGVGMLALALANALSGGDAVAALRDALEPMLRAAPDTDRSLIALAGIGILRQPDTALPGIQLGSIVVLAEPVREELIKQFLFVIESALRQTLSSLVLGGAILGGLLCVAWPRRVAARYATEMERAPLPPFHDWHIPNSLFRPMVATLLAAGLLMFLSGAQALLDVFNLLWSAVRTVIALQGGALLASLMRKSGVRSGNRLLAVVFLMIFLDFALVLLGFADQLLNPRALRKAANDRPDREEDK